MPISLPYKFSDWYGYDKDCSATTAFSSGAGFFSSRNICTQSISTTKYHNGSGTSPQVNDNIYDNSAGTTSTSDGYYSLGSGSNILGYYRVVNGVCTLVGVCFPPP